MKGTPAATPIHVGDLLKNYINDNRLYKSALARSLNVNDTVILAYQKRASINTNTLLRLSEALKYNFFADIAALLPTDFKKKDNPDTSKDQLIAQLQTEITILRAEKEVLLQTFKK